jgi:hypothetical protein
MHVYDSLILSTLRLWRPLSHFYVIRNASKVVWRVSGSLLRGLIILLCLAFIYAVVTIHRMNATSLNLSHYEWMCQ